jgi:hypothetical protein
MAIVVTTPAAKVGFIANGTSADASGVEQVVAAVAAAQIKVRHITLNNLTAGALNFTIGEGETVPGTIDDALIGPVSIGANSTLQWDFNPLMELTAATNLVLEADAGNVMVFTQGVIE